MIAHRTRTTAPPRRRLAALTALLLLGAAACADEMTTGPDESRDTGSIAVHAAVVPAFVAGLSVEVTAPDIAASIIANLPIANGAASGVVTVPAGANRLFTLRAYDRDGLVTHEGTATLTIRGGTNPTVAISLSPVAGQQPITVTFGTFAVMIENPPTTLQPGKSRQLSAVVVDGAGVRVANPAIEWGSLNPAVATVDASGRVTAVAIGQTRIGATYRGAGISVALTVAPGYTIAAIPLPAGCCTGGEATAINDAGVVVGTAWTTNGFVAFRWTADGGTELLGPIPGAGEHRSSTARGINGRGEVVGSYQPGGLDFVAMRWTTAEGMTTIGGVPGLESEALAIREDGTIVGQFIFAGGARGFLRTPAGDVSALGQWASWDVNAQGMIVGSLKVGPETAVALSSTGQFILLGTLDGGQNSTSRAVAVNDAGVVAGYSSTPAFVHAFIWSTAGGMRDLGALGGVAAGTSMSADINAAGQVVGKSTSGDASFHGFVWSEATGMVDLGILPGTSTTEALAINSRGQIVGRALDSQARPVPVIWTPVAAGAP